MLLEKLKKIQYILFRLFTEFHIETLTLQQQYITWKNFFFLLIQPPRSRRHGRSRSRSTSPRYRSMSRSRSPKRSVSPIFRNERSRSRRRSVSRSLMNSRSRSPRSRSRSLSPKRRSISSSNHKKSNKKRRWSWWWWTKTELLQWNFTKVDTLCYCTKVYFSLTQANCF